MKSTLVFVLLVGLAATTHRPFNFTVFGKLQEKSKTSQCNIFHRLIHVQTAEINQNVAYSFLGDSGEVMSICLSVCPRISQQNQIHTRNGVACMDRHHEYKIWQLHNRTYTFKVTTLCTHSKICHAWKVYCKFARSSDGGYKKFILNFGKTTIETNENLMRTYEVVSKSFRTKSITK
jgi:hypothetical protein